MSINRAFSCQSKLVENGYLFILLVGMNNKIFFSQEVSETRTSKSNTREIGV